MDIKEGTRCNEHWALCKTDESLTFTSETNNTVYVQLIEFKLKKYPVMQAFLMPCSLLITDTEN